MQAVMETVFSSAYLVTIVIFSVYILRKSNGEKQYKLFGAMALLLGTGDAFHLVPRMIALNTSGLENYAGALGLGTLAASITMTLFYAILYHIWRIRYFVTGKTLLSITVYGLAAIRIVLCLLPQNEWFIHNSSVTWGIYRNIPFVILGIILIALFYKTAKNDKTFKFLWLAVLLSFLFYIPVVILARNIPLIGMLMLPKTCAYVWVVYMGFSEVRKKHCARIRA
jgi:hypothetical protein